MNNLKVGFFGGSFDPIHFGHLQLARNLARVHSLKEVWFCPANINPHKQPSLPAPIEHRMNMIRLAIENDPHFSLLNSEANRKGPSYTIDTLRELIEKEKSSAFPKIIYLILSDEILSDFFHWKQPEEIVKLVPLLIGSRISASKTPARFEGNASICKAIELGWTPTELLPISSTEIRKRLSKGLDCSELVPKKVLDYIYQNKLYF